ncbi:MAG: DHH family phosphoesterase, partial [Pseudomonadales bacterium]
MKKRITRRQADSDGDFASSLPAILKSIYAARGVKTDSDLDCSLQHLLPPDSLLGIDSAVACMCDALHNHKRILIVGDFDADGATSCAVGVRGLRLLGFKDVDFLVPNRFEYGYGLTPEIVDVAAKATPDLIVTVDNGIAACEGVAHAGKLGIDVLVT